ncbi:MAG TPA: hypothetical protein VEC99_05965 [Clostridia bacterium]|nr:hypothetical protein [Clostridia bacterium]
MASVKEGTVKVGDVDYRWSVYRQPRWTTGRTHGYTLLGLAILVEHPEPSHRELLLEFDIDRTRHGDMPQHQRFRIHDGRLIRAIQDAMEAGWDPESRGKRYVYQAGSLQPRQVMVAGLSDFSEPCDCDSTNCRVPVRQWLRSGILASNIFYERFLQIGERYMPTPQGDRIRPGCCSVLLFIVGFSPRTWLD